MAVKSSYRSLIVFFLDKSTSIPTIPQRLDNEKDQARNPEKKNLFLQSDLEQKRAPSLDLLRDETNYKFGPPAGFGIHNFFTLTRIQDRYGL